MVYTLLTFNFLFYCPLCQIALHFQLYFMSLPLSARAVRRLQITGWRLGAAAAFTHYLSNPHFPPPLRQTARCVLAFVVEFVCPLSLI
jgi:hypothetical protein